MQTDNPLGTDGFDFLEFTTNQPKKLAQQFEFMGFHAIATHQSLPVTIYQQNDIRFIINLSKDSAAGEFSRLHGASVSAIGFRVDNAHLAYQYALNHAGKPYQAKDQKNVYNVPAIYGLGDSLIYFIDYKNNNNKPNYASQFSYAQFAEMPRYNAGLTYIDHITQCLQRDNLFKWANFYKQVFNFHEIRYTGLDTITGLTSKAMISPCGKIRIPLIQPDYDKSQINDFVTDFNGEGIQHIALGSNHIYDSVETLRIRGLEFLETPDAYYDLIEKRLPKHGEPLESLKKYKILIDGDLQNSNEKKLLLQIFTKDILDHVFFEIIQRKGYDGFSEKNLLALFEAKKLDQRLRNATQLEDETS